MADGPLLAERPSGWLARSSLVAFVTYGVGAALTYLSQLVIARVVGASSYGVYAYVIAWATVLAYFSVLGSDITLLRLVPAYRTQQAWGLLRGVIRYTERRVLVAAFGVVLGGVCVIVFWARPSAELRAASLIGLFLVPVWALLWMRAAAVRGLGGVISALAPDRLVRDGLLLGFIGLAALPPGWSVGAPLVVLGTLASSLAGLVLVSIAARRRWPRSLNTIEPQYASRVWRRAALPLVLVAVAEAAMNRTGVVLFGWLGDTKEAGIFAVIFNISSLALLPRMAVNALLAPLVSELFVRNDRVALQDVTAKAALWTLVGAGAIALPLLLLAGPLLAWFGRDFVAGASAMRLLLVGQVAVAATGSQLLLMTMTGHERAAAVILIACAAGNGALTVLLIGVLGLSGAAAASTAMLLAWNAAMAVFIWRELSLVPGPFMRRVAISRAVPNMRPEAP